MRVSADTNYLYGSQRVQTATAAAVRTDASCAAKSLEKALQLDSATASRSSNAQRTDFTHMTGNQMQSAAAELYEAGTIDLTQLGMLQMAGPLGKVGPNGEFVLFTPAERDNIRNQPVDYLQLTQDAIAGIESRGDATDPQSGYADWKQILSALQTNQNSISGVDVQA